MPDPTRPPSADPDSTRSFGPAPSAGTLSARILGDGPVRLWGMTSAERLARSLRRVGIADAAAWENGSPPAGPVILLRGDWVFDEVLVRDLVAAPGTVLIDDVSGDPVAAHVEAQDAAAIAEILSGPPGTGGRRGTLPATLRQVAPGELSSAYNNALRKREAPFLLRLMPESRQAIEDRMFAGSYKGVTDVVTKHVWPWPAQRVTKWCAVAGLTPNQVTLASFVLVLIAFWLFWTGQFLAGLLAAWAMTFLDTVDGKLARVTLTSSKWGNVFDHGIDLVHPPFWWWAWIVGLGAVGQPLPETWLVLAVIVGGYVAQRIQEGVFLALFKIEIHIWRPFDSFFRLITARRNPNLILLTLGAIAGRPDLGMLAVAAWTVICFAVHQGQIVQAMVARRRGPIVSWLAS